MRHDRRECDYFSQKIAELSSLLQSLSLNVGERGGGEKGEPFTRGKEKSPLTPLSTSIIRTIEIIKFYLRARRRREGWLGAEWSKNEGM